MSGSGNYHSGLAAEEAVARHYAAAGARPLATRMRNAGGEIDLIVDTGTEIVFVEVKARRSAASAAAALSAAQAARIRTAAEIWLDETGRGALTPCRFDVATVDGTGRVAVVENALGG